MDIHSWNIIKQWKYIAWIFKLNKCQWRERLVRYRDLSWKLEWWNMCWYLWLLINIANNWIKMQQSLHGWGIRMSSQVRKFGIGNQEFGMWEGQCYELFIFLHLWSYPTILSNLFILSLNLILSRLAFSSIHFTLPFLTAFIHASSSFYPHFYLALYMTLTWVVSYIYKLITVCIP